VTGSYLAYVAGNDVNHAPTVSMQPFASIVANVRLDDGSTPAVAWNADGTFAFAAAPGQGYWLTLIGNGIYTDYQLAASQLELAEPIWSRLDRVAPGAGTQVTYNLTAAPPASAAVYTQSTGQWSLANAPGTMTSYTIDWTKVPTWPKWGALGSIGLLDTSHNDRLYLTVFDVIAGKNYAIVDGYRIDDVTLTSGATKTISGGYQAITPTTCIAVDALRGTEANRLAAAGYGTTFSGSWWLEAFPTPQLGVGGDLLLAYSLDNTPPTTDTTGQPMIENIFTGHSLVLRMAVGTSRAVTAPNATSSMPVYNTSFHWVVPTLNCATPSQILGSVALPGQPVLAGTTLDTDGKPIAVDRSGPVQLTWPVSGRFVDHYRVELYEVYADAANASQMALRVRTRTLAPHASIDPAALEVGKTYLYEVTAVLGYPSSGAGDFRTVAFPLGEGLFTSNTFTITQ
jgi:hypothetical protein